MQIPDIKKIKKQPVIIAIAVIMLLIIAIIAFNEKTEIKENKQSIIPKDFKLESVLKLPASYSDIETKSTKKSAENEQNFQIQKAGLNYRSCNDNDNPYSYQGYESIETKKPVYKEIENQSIDDEVKEKQEIKKDHVDSAKNSSLFFNTGFTTNKDTGKHQKETYQGLSGQDFESENIKSQRYKQDFIEKAKDIICLNKRIQKLKSPYQLMSGTVLPGILITGINSDLPGQIIGQIRENVFDTVTGKYLLIPQGSRLIGQYDNMVVYGQERVLLVWSRLIFPNGDSIQLDSMPGADIAGFSGMKDKVKNHIWKISRAVLLSSFLSTGAKYASLEDENNLSFAQTMGKDAGAGFNQSGQKIVSKNLNVQPCLEIRPGKRFSVMVNKDIILKPYGSDS